MQASLYRSYGWDPFWGGGNDLGAYQSGMGGAFEPSPYRGGPEVLDAERRACLSDDGDPHLRRVIPVVGYHIRAKDGPTGHVENVLVDDATWGIRYLVIDTKNWWPGQHVLMFLHAVGEISWWDRDVTLQVTRDQVKDSPSWDPAGMIEGL